MATQSVVPAFTLSIGSVLAWSPFGLQLETIALGMCVAAFGMFGRFAFDMQKALEGGESVRLALVGRALAWTAYGLIGAPFITTLWLVFLKFIGVQTDVMTVGGLLLLGFVGPKGISQLVAAAGGTLGQYLPKGRTP